MADYYSQRALAVKSQTESSLRANSQRQQLEPSQQASSTMGGGSVQQVFHPILARLHSIQHQQVPPGTIMVEGAPVFLTCQDQELLEVAKAVLREKFPQVKILGCAVCPSGPSMDGRAGPSRRAFVEKSPSKARIFVILPVYM